MRRLFALLLFLLFPIQSYGAGAILVDTSGSGQPVLWQGGIINYNLESGEAGTLGSLSNDEAVTLVRDLFEAWKVTINGVSTTNLTINEGTSLGSVDSSNMNDHFTYCPASETCSGEAAPFVVGSARTGESPMLFDTDGALIDLVQGTGASRSILGFAGPRVVERSGGVLFITEGQAILNGRFIDGVSDGGDPEVSIDAFKGAIFHEVGHFMGIDHTQVNLGSVVKHLQGDTSESVGIPTMFPLFVDGTEQLSPHFDDQVAVSMLYPSSDYSSSFCQLQGVILEANGSTELQGVNVIATNPANALVESTSFVSGAHFAGSSSGCAAAEGDYTITGLTPGITYSLSIESISQAFTGGSSIEPCDPAQSGFDDTSVAGLFSCTAAGEVITNGTEATTTVISTKESSTANGSGDSGSSGGGCSLIPSHR